MKYWHIHKLITLLIFFNNQKAIGFIWGFYTQQFSQTLLILCAGVLLSCLLILPPFPFWNRNQIKWQAVASKVEESTEASSQAKDSKKLKKK
jgi:signal peptidase complex subunit 1